MIERVFIKQGIRKIELENYLKKELERAGFTGLDIVKTPLVTRIVINVSRPGLAIGKEGQNIKQLTEDIGKRFGIENPQLEIQETPQASLNATAVVNKMVSLLERGYSWRSVAFRTVRDVTGAGAQGVELIFSGKLAGKGGRKKRVRVAEGYMKKVGNQVKLVDYAKASSYPKAGAIGIKLRIIRPGVVFPDKINIEDFIKPAEEKAAGEKKEIEEVKEAEKPMGIGGVAEIAVPPKEGEAEEIPGETAGAVVWVAKEEKAKEIGKEVKEKAEAVAETMEEGKEIEKEAKGKTGVAEEKKVEKEGGRKKKGKEESVGKKKEKKEAKEKGKAKKEKAEGEKDKGRAEESK